MKAVQGGVMALFSGFLLLAVFGMHAESGAAEPSTAVSTAKLSEEKKLSTSGDENRIVDEGLSIEFKTVPLSGQGEAVGKKLIEGRDAKVRFTIKDQATGAPLRGLYPAAWMDKQHPDAKGISCKEKIGSFLQARLAFRPTNDLNAWYIVALNEKASISVLDPLVETGASQMLLDLVLLDSPGEAWTLDSKSERLYVTLPDTGKVAVVDTVTWDVSNYIKVGPRPVQIAFQPDGKYLWVGINGGLKGQDEPGGAAVIDPDTHKIVAKIPTGHGHHEIAFSDDSRFAYLTNETDGTVSIIDVWNLKKIKDIKAGQQPTSLTYSSTAHSLYVVDSQQGAIYVIDGKTHDSTASVETKAGSTKIRFAPDGRWGFVTNPTEKKVMILDASVNRIAHSFAIGTGPYHIAFSDTYAFVHSMGSATISIIGRNSLNTRGAIPVTEIPVGKRDSKNIPSARAESISITPEKSSLVIANPNDESIYFYMEGMNAPMGAFGNFQRRPKAVMTIDKGLRETSPGVYEAVVKLKTSGIYDVAFLLDSPQITHCFSAAVAVDPALKAKRNLEVNLDFITKDKFVPVGQPVDVRVKLTEGEAGTPKTEVKDLLVLAIATGNWQKRVYAESVADGEYLARFSFPSPGVYFVFFSSDSLKVSPGKWPRLVLHAKKKNLSKKRASEN